MRFRLTKSERDDALGDLAGFLDHQVNLVLADQHRDALARLVNLWWHQPAAPYR
jgi:hypothetical protein